ncbi:DUF4381 domain-containing protein [Colwellia piezophila]|uniref:DUF4381 domain-containing protein n=1 Tax=Colwellia piezophila TaxID=211668 RepID=UPI00036442DC|nr:DUF4381 domain-containing protein [Colwellia piezophila]
MSFEKPWGNYLLEAIVETKAPETISFLPQTIAWQLIFTVLIIIILRKCHQKWQNYQANAYRREALFWLSQCSLSKEEDIRQLPALLRKTAILASNRHIKESDSVKSKTLALKVQQEVIELRGQAWAKWLDQNCSKCHFHEKTVEPSSTTHCSEKLLSQLSYMATIDLNDAHVNKSLIQLHQQIECWIKHHHLTISAQSESLGVSA